MSQSTEPVSPSDEQVHECAERSRRDWPEDFSHENGNYHSTCNSCGLQFTGHKRRIWCRVCSTPESIKAESDRLSAALDEKEAEIDKWMMRDFSTQSSCSLLSQQLAAQQSALVAARDVMTRALPTIDSRITDYADEYRAAVLARVNACLPPQ